MAEAKDIAIRFKEDGRATRRVEMGLQLLAAAAAGAAEQHVRFDRTFTR